MDYPTPRADIKARIRAAQTRAVSAVNSELLRLYWEIGRVLDDRSEKEGWGAAVIPRLARDIKNALPEQKGFSEPFNALPELPHRLHTLLLSGSHVHRCGGQRGMP
ncbi:DUF1016 N-terminal domain-containing protein [Aquabacterium sp. A7-Y]|uniref:DUF1016 N-terminal domain-containing protein n=1 Tax=Aquabacterium sp. A7-Y TaxID=1349605 RepID=UPI00223E3D21|nr:DUF1016 N-terminal domain-containing protein [Aquabacterium sp. A7-Y]MCW7539450.1 DUF1016 N-terminal domain-containing protein [Aquabacterium sp. A7-Y]